MKDLLGIKSSEQGIQSFLRLTQFIFLLSATFFVALKFGLTENVEYLKDLPISEGLLYVVGGLAIAAYGGFYVVLLGQRSKIKELEETMNKIKYRRLV